MHIVARPRFAVRPGKAKFRLKIDRFVENATRSRPLTEGPGFASRNEREDLVNVIESHASGIRGETCVGKLFFQSLSRPRANDTIPTWFLLLLKT